MMTPLVLGLGVPELLIILAVVLLLFGGSRLAGLGKSSGRALREFKEETKSLKGEEQPAPPAEYTPPPAPPTAGQQPPQGAAPQPPTFQQPPTYQQPPAGNAQTGEAEPRRDA
jgi:sec-independent protein translocase protein TatA